MAFEKYKISNNAFGTLIAGISASATSAQLQSGEGAKYPATGNFIGTLVQYSTPADPTSDIVKQESVLVTGIASDILTITRGFGGDTPTAFNAGDWLYLNVRAEHIQDIYDEVDRLETDKLNKGGLRTALANTWRMFFSNGSNNETELALGASGTYLKSNGASTTPEWSNPPLDINGQSTVTTATTAFFVALYNGSSNVKITLANLVKGLGYATTSQQGVVELATTTETKTGTDATRAITADSNKQKDIDNIGTSTNITLSAGSSGNIQASQNGFVSCYAESAGSGSYNISIFTDATATPTTKVSGFGNINKGSCMYPIKKGDYYRVTNDDVGDTTNAAYKFIPLG